MAFTRGFGKYACAGDIIETEVDGFTIYARIEYDADSNPEDQGLDPKQDAEVIAAWNRDEWFYCGIKLSVSKDGIVLDKHAASLWAIECNFPGSDNSYLLEVANEMLSEAVAVGKEALAKLCGDRDHKALLAIQAEMDGVEWSIDTLSEIALILERAGYSVRDLRDEEVS